MPKVTAEHFRALGAQQFANGEPPPADTGTWQSRARLAGWDQAHGEAASQPLVATPQPGWCDGCTPDECPGCGNAMLAMTAQESAASIQPVRGPFLVADIASTMQSAVNATKALIVALADERPAAYLRWDYFLGWTVHPIDGPITLHGTGIKRKTHARNVANRMGYRVVDEPA